MSEASGLKEVAEQALIGLINGVTEAANFLKGEIPIAVRELLTYYTVYYAVMLAVLLLYIPLAYKAIRIVWAATPEHRHHDGHLAARVASGIVLPIIGLVSVCAAFFNIVPSLLKITLAPRIWLIEYAASLVK